MVALVAVTEQLLGPGNLIESLFENFQPPLTLSSLKIIVQQSLQNLEDEEGKKYQALMRDSLKAAVFAGDKSDLEKRLEKVELFCSKNRRNLVDQTIQQIERKCFPVITFFRVSSSIVGE